MQSDQRTLRNAPSAEPPSIARGDKFLNLAVEHWESISKVEGSQQVDLLREMRLLKSSKNFQDRCQAGRNWAAASGRNPCGRAYGYAPVKGSSGELTIVEEEAAVVRRIFEAYISGRSAGKIAADLNRSRVRPPRRGTLWTTATIIGSRGRASGILRNSRYVGLVTYNVTRQYFDPATNRLKNELRAPSEWTVGSAPSLRIISDSVWEAAKSLLPR
jgi:hypothetical protein